MKQIRGKSGTYIPFVAANGTLIMNVFILPLDKKEPSAFQLMTKSKKGECPTYWGFTKSGYLDGETWIPVLQKLHERMEVIAPGITPVLLLDNLSVHKSENALWECIDLGMKPIFFPSNTTHFLQPP